METVTPFLPGSSAITRQLAPRGSPQQYELRGLSSVMTALCPSPSGSTKEFLHVISQEPARGVPRC